MTPSEQEKSRERARRWRAANLERARENARLYYYKNKEKMQAQARGWSKRNPERKNELNRERCRLSVRAYDSLFAAQDGTCAICRKAETTTLRGKVKRLSVDHCHTTGKIRSLLCSACNLAIGHLRDDPDLARKVAAYLEHHSEPK